MARKRRKNDFTTGFYKRINKNKKPKRSIAIGRLIDDKLEQLENSNLDVLSKVEISNEKCITHIESKDVYVEEKTAYEAEFYDYEHAALFVFEPKDLDDLTLEEIETVWKKRDFLCKSDRAAAETLALFEVSTGISEYYKGWQNYINHPDIIEIRNTLSRVSTKDESTKNSKPLNIFQHKNIHKTAQEINPHFSYSLKQVQELTFIELKAAWSQRPDSFYSIEAASEALARIRYETQIDTQKRSWKLLSTHPAISEISTELESETKDMDFVSKKEAVEITKNEKVYGFVKQQIRIGQTNFREIVINGYEGTCCISGCTELASLEAAHIRPYSGNNSNKIENSLLLRADIHKLFDRFLISIHPKKQTLVISNQVTDEYYTSLMDKQLFKGRIKPSLKYLNEHYETFIKVNKFMSTT